MVGFWELFVILLVILVLFGGKKLPEFARNLGKGMREFRKASQGIIEEEIEENDDNNFKKERYLCQDCKEKKP